MDKQQLLGYFQDHYLSRQDVLFKLPLNISIDSFWQDLVNQRKARATMLPLYSATGQPYWFVTTDKMVKASERLCEEAMKHDAFFDPYRIPLSQSLTSALSQEAYFTSFVEGADYPIQAAVDFLRRGSEPENAYEQNIMNNYQAGSYLLSALSIPFDEGFVKELAATLTDGQDGYRTTDNPGIPAMDGEPFRVPPAHMLADRMGQFYAFLADVRVHPLIKAAVGQAYILATRPFEEANERLGRLISNAVLLRYGYDFFLDISISAYIARESYRYFKAMREIIRSDNDGDMTYFVEYYLELLVRALDGTRMEEAERLQSQLEAERKMALQPLKQPTVQYTQPHAYDAAAIARVIDSAEEEAALPPNVEAGEDTTRDGSDPASVAAPGPPDLPGGDASYRSSQSQAGSTQGDRKAAAPQMRQTVPQGGNVAEPLPPGDACPPESGVQLSDATVDGADRLLGLTRQIFSRIGLMLEVGISAFTSLQWAEITGLTHKEAATECRGLYQEGLANRVKDSTAYYYTLRFSSKDYTAAQSKIEKANYAMERTQENWNAALSLMERSGINSCVKAAAYMRHCRENGILRFFPCDLKAWGTLWKRELTVALQLLTERGLIQKPSSEGVKYDVILPPSQRPPSTAGSEGELLQAVVAPADQAPQTLSERLDALSSSNHAAERRIANVISSFMKEGRLRFTFVDWATSTGLSKSVVGGDLMAAADYGLVRKMKPAHPGGAMVYEIDPNPKPATNWDGMTANTCKVLGGIVRSFGTRSFTAREAAEVAGLPVERLAYFFRILRTRSIIVLHRRTQYNCCYSLAVPLEDAVRYLKEQGYTQMALAG